MQRGMAFLGVWLDETSWIYGHQKDIKVLNWNEFGRTTSQVSGIRRQGGKVAAGQQPHKEHSAPTESIDTKVMKSKYHDVISALVLYGR